MPYYLCMALDNFIGWATGVNRTILDSSSFTFGENALKTDELESGLKRTKAKNPFWADKFTVKMSFNWVDEVVIKTYGPNHEILSYTRTGKTEFQLFTEWYKYKHKYGSVPFEFPKILYSQNTGIRIYDEADQAERDVEYYRITSAVQGNKSGDCIEVSMTWETVYSGIVSIPASVPEINSIYAKSNYVDVYFTSLGDTQPTAIMFAVFTKENSTYTEVEMKGFVYDGCNVVRLYYDELEEGTTVTIELTYPDYFVERGTFEADI